MTIHTLLSVGRLMQLIEERFRISLSPRFLSNSRRGHLRIETMAIYCIERCFRGLRGVIYPMERRAISCFSRIIQCSHRAREPMRLRAISRCHSIDRQGLTVRIQTHPPSGDSLCHTRAHSFTQPHIKTRSLLGWLRPRSSQSKRNWLSRKGEVKMTTSRHRLWKTMTIRLQRQSLSQLITIKVTRKNLQRPSYGARHQVRVASNAPWPSLTHVEVARSMTPLSSLLNAISSSW